MALGLGSNLSRAISKPITPGIVTDNLVLKHQYNAGSVVLCSDGAAFFDGSDDYIECGTTGLNPNSVTVSTWVKFPGEDSSDSYARIFEADGDEKSYHLRYDKADDRFVVRLSSNGSDHTLCQGTGVVTSFAPWYHVAFTYNTSDGAIKLYVNGTLNGTATHSGGGNLHVPSTPGVRIGQESNTTNNNWDGYICNVGVWSSVLTQPQIKSIMNKNYAGLTTSEKTNLVSWWNLDSAYDIDDTTESTETTQYVFDNHHGGGDTLGSDVMIGGDMSSDSGWTLSSGWSISNGKLVCETSSFNAAYKTTSGLTEGKLYKVTVDVATTNGNPLLVYLGEGHSGSVTANVRGRTQTTGTNVFYLVAGATNQIYFYAGSVSARWNGTIDNVIIQEVNGNYGVLS